MSERDELPAHSMDMHMVAIPLRLRDNVKRYAEAYARAALAHRAAQEGQPLARINRYCSAGMCLKSDAQHEADCQQYAAPQPAEHRAKAAAGPVAISRELLQALIAEAMRDSPVYHGPTITAAQAVLVAPQPPAAPARPEVCCGEYATCSRPCTPRGRWQAEQGPAAPMLRRLTDTDVARIYRKVYGGNRYGSTERIFATELESALAAKNGARIE